jgi:hypothetical protein
VGRDDHLVPRRDALCLQDERERVEAAARLPQRETASARTVVEIGSAQGGTLFLLSTIATDDALIVSLDLPTGRFGGFYRAACEAGEALVRPA